MTRSVQCDLMGLPAGEDSVRKIKAVKPAAEIVTEMMAEAQEILRAETVATGDRFPGNGIMRPCVDRWVELSKTSPARFGGRIGCRARR